MPSIDGTIVPRNDYIQPAQNKTDVRLQQRIPLGNRANIDLIGEAFNVTRSRNLNFGPDAISAYGTPAQPVATAGQPLFAPSTARFGGPRQVQLGMRLVF